MIHSVWKPKFTMNDGVKVITNYELVPIDKMVSEKKTGWVVRYYCDECKSCKLETTKSKVFFNNDTYLNTLDKQMCRSCRSRYSEYKVKNNFIPFDVFEKSIIDSDYRLLTTKDEYNSANNKSQFKMNIICNKEHNLTTTWNNWNKGKRCRLCYENNKLENSIKNKDGWEKYYFLVWYYSEKNYLEHKNQINPNNYRRGKNFHLDHKFSICEGFKNNVPPILIGGVNNLEVIPAKENLKKGTKCSLKINEIENAN